MAIVAFPAISAPQEVTWQLRAQTQQHVSPFNGSTQTLAMPGGVWTSTLTWRAMGEQDRRVMEGWLAGLRGAAGRFTLRPYHAPRRATGTGTPVMNGSIQTGTSISIKGWAASAQAFKAGDFLSYLDDNGRSLLHIVTADSNATGGGFASVSISPPVRRIVPDGRAIEIAAPVGVFRLATDDEGQMVTVFPPVGAVTINVVEALV